MNLRTIRLILWSLVGVAAIAGAILYVTHKPAPTAEAVTIGAPFVLTDADGKAFSSEKLAGRPYAMFFGFTHCPDVCPTTLARLAKLRNQLGKGPEAFDIVLVSVDPERDTPADIKNYVKLFGTPVIGLTGTVADIEAVKKSFGIFSEKVPDGNGGYTVDHSAQVLLFNRDGSFGGTIAFDETDAPALQKLRNIADS